MPPGEQAAFLFDLFPRGDEMVLWFVTPGGQALRAVETFHPTVLLEGDDAPLRACVRAIERCGDGEGSGWTERHDFWTDRPKRVFAVRVLGAETWRQRLAHHARRHPRVTWHQADLLPEQHFCFERGVWPLALCHIAICGGRLASLRVVDDRAALEYPLPPLRTADLSVEGHLHGGPPRLMSVTLEHGGQSVTWDEPEGMLAGLQRELDDCDPDVILTRGGDALTMPLLFSVAQRQGFALRLDREPALREREIVTEGRSLFSYGRTMHRDPDYPLFGRWHLDHRSWLLGQDDRGGADGLFEVVRLSRLPVQRVARRSIGAGLTSVQLGMALEEGYLIPWRKAQPEVWKTANQLLAADRGGLVYAPEIGFHESVVELDFVSMYPSIMARFNVSPETVNCPCCREGPRVPELGYVLCQRRRGLVSRSLAPIVERRIQHKRIRDAAPPGSEVWKRHNARAAALKWILVCSFGYLGYRHARFGRIEAHESVNAFARELLLTAKEMAEAHGWRMIHANVDSLYLTKPGFCDEEIAPLCRLIEEATGLDIALEGIHRWLAFLPSRVTPGRPVPARLFSVFRSGALKCRGVECRRGDVPPFVADAQRCLLEILARARDRREYEGLIPTVLREVEEMEGALRRHEVPLDDLVIRQRLSQAPEDYRGSGMQAVAARQSVRAGLRLHAGQALEYIIVDAKAREADARVRVAALIEASDTPDPVAYIRLLRRAVNTLLWPVGMELEEEDRPPAPRRRRSYRSAGAEQLDLLGGGE